MRFGSAVLSILVATSLVACFRTPACAGAYHTGESLHCSDCHISHASAGHDEVGQPLGWTQTPRAFLTKGNTSSEVCLRCHDNQSGIPDVMGSDINNPSELYDGTERAGGQFSEGNSDNFNGHNLPTQGTTSPGGCTACHDPHGNGNYRNLRALNGVRRHRRQRGLLCLSCHKAHGSVHPFGMQWQYGVGDGLRAASGCNQCHNVSGD